MEITKEILIKQRDAEREERDAALARANAALGRIQLLNDLIKHLEQEAPKDEPGN